MNKNQEKNTSKMFIVVGDDSYIGANVIKKLSEKYEYVHGFSQDDTVNFINNDELHNDNENACETRKIDSSWVIICLEPNMGFEKYVSKLKKILDDMDNVDFYSDICYFSSASICQIECEKAISEENLVYPSSERDLCYATGENLLHLLSYSEKSYIEPHIFRVGVPYGENVPCFVNDMIENAQRGNEIKVPMGSDITRTLTHIDDVCEAVIELIDLKFCPQLVNIAGETKNLAEIGKAIAKKYEVEFREQGLSPLCNQELSAELFNESITFTPKYTFNKWLDEQ